MCMCGGCAHNILLEPPFCPILKSCLLFTFTNVKREMYCNRSNERNLGFTNFLFTYKQVFGALFWSDVEGVYVIKFSINQPFSTCSVELSKIKNFV